MGGVIDASDAASFQDYARRNEKVIAFFWAPWSEPCKALDAVVAEAVRAHDALSCAKVEAERIQEVSGHLKVTAVPTFVFIHKGREVDRQEGYDPASFYEKASLLAELTTETLESRLKTLIGSNPVMLFMKGSPDAPRCGFSRKVVQALQDSHIPFGSFDILSDQEVRQGLKELSNWPTYPQLYAGGELLGGCDIILELAQTGELKESVEEALKEAGMSLPVDKDMDVQQRIEKLVQSKSTLLFMKGTPDAPRCGFSRRVVEALRGIKQPFEHFDILADEEVRQGVKKYSDWPTFPQLFVGGEMIGGCDVITELATTGELSSTIESALKDAQNGASQ